MTTLQQALRAEGYFDGTVGFRLEEPSTVPTQGVVNEVERLAKKPEVVLVFDVQPGPRYLFGRLDIDIVQDSAGFTAPSPASLGLVEGEPARTQLVLDAEQKLLTDARKAGFALAALQDRDAIVDHDTRRMNLTLKLEPASAPTSAPSPSPVATASTRLPAWPRADQGGATLRSHAGRRRPEATVRHQPVLDHRHPSGHAADGRGSVRCRLSS